jgi:hypothetical protein
MLTHRLATLIYVLEWVYITYLCSVDERIRYVAYDKGSSCSRFETNLSKKPSTSRDFVQPSTLVEYVDTTPLSFRIETYRTVKQSAYDVSDDGGSAITSESSGHLSTSAKSSQTSKDVSNSQGHRPTEHIGEDDDSDEKPPPAPSRNEPCSHLDEQGGQCPILVSGIAAKTFSSCKTRRKEFSHTVYAPSEIEVM